MTRLLFLLALLLPLPSLADTLHIPVGQQGSAAQPLPQRGEPQHSVTQRFGQPEQQHPAVGQPPISRWDYASFSVYFETDRVIDSVRHHQPRP